LLLFCLKAYSLFFSLWPLLQNARTKIAIVYAGTMYDTIDDTMIYARNGRCGSMITKVHK
jgi:hypothetical protein